MSKYNKTKISGMFESQYGYGIKVTEEVLEALSTLGVGDYLNLTRVKDETRERIASERGKDVADTIAAYLEFSSLSGGGEAPAPVGAKTAATKPSSRAGRVEKF